jgi:ferredoxin
VRFRVDATRCEGHGRCYALAPALVALDDFGAASVIGDGSVAPADEALVRLIAANCPEFAIDIIDE